MKSEWFEKLELYIGEEMGYKEKTLFEAELASNDELRDFVELYRNIEQEMQTHHSLLSERNELKKTLNALGTKYFPPGND